MNTRKKMWISILLSLLLILVSGLMAACSSSDEDGDPEDEDLPEIGQTGAAVTAEESYIVMQIAFDFGPGVTYDVELLEFSMEAGEDSYYRYLISPNGEAMQPTVLLRHSDGYLFTYYEEDGAILPLEEDPALSPYMSEDVKYMEEDSGHGLPGAVDIDELYNHMFDEYDDYYEGYDGYDYIDPSDSEVPVTPQDEGSEVVRN